MRANFKVILIIVASIILLGSLVYLTLIVQDGSNPLGMFGIRASNPEDEQDPFLKENNVTSDPIVETSTTPTPTQVLLGYNSTSPTVTPATESASLATPSATIAVSNTPTPTIIITQLPTENELAQALVATQAVTPTTIQQLPVSGITDHVDKIFIGGGFLILIGLLL